VTRSKSCRRQKKCLRSTLPNVRLENFQLTTAFNWASISEISIDNSFREAFDVHINRAYSFWMLRTSLGSASGPIHSRACASCLIASRKHVRGRRYYSTPANDDKKNANAALSGIIDHLKTKPSSEKTTKVNFPLSFPSFE
jgi:hypothetical protein